MGILRDNRDSVMAMLEAFVYDPLISWRLVAESGGYLKQIIKQLFKIAIKIGNDGVVVKGVTEAADLRSGAEDNPSISGSKDTVSALVSQLSQSLADVQESHNDNNTIPLRAEVELVDSIVDGLDSNNNSKSINGEGDSGKDGKRKFKDGDELSNQQLNTR
jgi:phosphatidylinositol kinase/protein kinase (PI-3  family)